MADIVLATLNAKYIHAAFGLRYLMANLGDLLSAALLIEFDINQRPVDIAEILLAQKPTIIGLGIYIWNVAPAREVVEILKRLRPEIKIILGGPEVSYEPENQPIVCLADFVITGEADLKFAEVCKSILNGAPPLEKIIPASLPDLAKIELPYELYGPDDVANRIIYVEASRGCPFTCEFCLSSLDIPVRQFSLPELLSQFDGMLERGVKQFKFVDRTFNLNIKVGRQILEFFLERLKPAHFLHFEMIPDRLPEELRGVIRKFPPGSLQFEVGIQTFNEEVGARIKRRQNYERLEENLAFLRNETGVHIHADLIAGLPGETLESFGRGFDKLIALGPQEIQVGILKRLRGTPIVRHDHEWGMVYNPNPPYEILQTRTMDLPTIQRLRRFAKYWDLVGNSGNFAETLRFIWEKSGSPFQGFLDWSDWLYGRVGRTDSIALSRLMEYLFQYLTREAGMGAPQIAATLWNDYLRAGRNDKPVFLKPFLDESVAAPFSRKPDRGIPRRQARHLTPRD